MAEELNNVENYSINLTEVSLHTSSSDISSTIGHDSESLYKEVYIYSLVTALANDSNPKKVFTVIADTTNYKAFGFYFNGYASLASLGQYSDMIQWGIGYNALENTWYNDGLDTISNTQYAIENPGNIDNYAELTSGTPNKFDFYMDLKSYGNNQSYRVSGNLQIFANNIKV